MPFSKQQVQYCTSKDAYDISVLRWIIMQNIESMKIIMFA